MRNEYINCGDVSSDFKKLQIDSSYVVIRPYSRLVGVLGN